MKLTLLLVALLAGVATLSGVHSQPLDDQSAPAASPEDLEGADLQGEDTLLLRWLLNKPSHYGGGYRRHDYGYAPRYHAPRYYKPRYYKPRYNTGYGW